MTVITDIRVASSDFSLGELFASFPDVEVELERIIPVESGIIPFLWVSNADPDAVEQTLRADPLVDDVQQLTRADSRYLFRVNWSPDVDRIVQPLVQHDVDVLRAYGSPDAWEFRLQFRDREQLGSFHDDCVAHDVEVDVHRIFNPSHPWNRDAVLTEAQAEAVHLAYQSGYWNVPREATLEEVATKIGISDTALSQRLRRGTKALVEEYVYQQIDA